MHFLFLICSCSFFFFCFFWVNSNSICEYYTWFNLCRERLCECLRRVWFLCAVITRRNLLKQGFIMGNEFDKQAVCKNLFNFSWIIRLRWFNWFQKWCREKNVMILVRQACGMGGELGSKMMGFEEKTTLMTATMFGSKVVLNYILETSCCCCGLAISTEVVKLLLDASALHFVYCCILLTMYSTLCSFYSCCFFAL